VPNPWNSVFATPTDWRFLEAAGQRHLGDDGRWNVVVNARDVTERRQLEAELRHAQKDGVGRPVGRWRGPMISNNILTVIQGMLRCSWPEDRSAGARPRPSGKSTSPLNERPT